jgi:sterol desaturase/sphingolipid hydroxylase (fatty acid hydroxylase superfamily)
MTYDWLAAIAYVATLTVMTLAGKWIAFKSPVLQEMRELNAEADKPKMGRDAFRAAVKVNNTMGMYTNLGFYFLILPFCVSFAPRPLWLHLVEIVAVLAIFDFMYYWTHRLLFHGNPMRKIHALHHQARTPTYIDAHYVHPLETFIGLSLFLVSIPIVALIEGAPINVFSASIATLVFTQINTLNHTFTKLPAGNWLFRSVDYVTGVHHAHHVDMNQGNFATLTMFYDKLFGTFEEPVNRETA